MGFEYQLVAVLGSSSISWKAAEECFKTQVTSFARVSAGSPIKSALNGAYEWVGLSVSTWLEDFVLAQEKDKCYVCFHGGTTEQINSILDLLTSCCLTAGIIGTFEEL